MSHLDFDKAPDRSTLSDANSKHSYLFFESVNNELLAKHHSSISDTRLKGLGIRNLEIIDSSTISLFSDLLAGVGRNRLDDGKEEGGFKAHTIMDAFSGVA